MNPVLIFAPVEQGHAFTLDEVDGILREVGLGCAVLDKWNGVGTDTMSIVLNVRVHTAALRTIDNMRIDLPDDETARRRNAFHPPKGWV